MKSKKSTPNSVGRKYTKKQFIDASDTVHEVVERWIIHSIESTFRTTSRGVRRSSSEGHPLAAYILLSCAIDVLAGFYCGRNPSDSRGAGKHYKEFVAKYMPSYSPDILYKDLRCGLVHNFILGDGLGLTYEHPELHNRRDNIRVTKNFENLFSDFKRAYLNYFNDLDHDKDLSDLFMERFSRGGILALNLENLGIEGTSPVLRNYVHPRSGRQEEVGV